MSCKQVILDNLLEKCTNNSCIILLYLIFIYISVSMLWFCRLTRARLLAVGSFMWCELLLNSIWYSHHWNGVLMFINRYLRLYLSNEIVWLHNITMAEIFIYVRPASITIPLCRNYVCVSIPRKLPYLYSIYTYYSIIHYFYVCLLNTGKDEEKQRENQYNWKGVCVRFQGRETSMCPQSTTSVPPQRKCQWSSRADHAAS